MTIQNETGLIPKDLMSQICEALQVKEEELSLIVNEKSYQYLDQKGLIKEVVFSLQLNTTCIAQFTLAPLIGCCGVCISTGAVVLRNWRNKGLGKLLNLLRIHIATHLGYGLLLATSKETNEPQSKIFFANGWEAVQQFVNPRTGNHLVVHTYVLEGGR